MSTPGGESVADFLQHDHHESASEVRYPLARFAKPSRRGRVFIVIMYIAIGVMAVAQLVQGRLPLFPLLSLSLAAYTQWRVRSRGREALATNTGISGPHLRKPILWDDVASLQEPLRYDPEIVVTMRDGSRRGTGFPPSYFEALTALTSTPVAPKDS